MTRPGWLTWILEESLPGVGVRLLLGYTPTFAGRATRRELLVTAAIVAVGGLILSAIYGLYLDRLDADDTDSVLKNLLPIGQIVILGLPLLSAAVRRLHDVNRHAWALGIVLVPYVGAILLTALLLWKGEPLENAFGPNPRPPEKDRA